MVEWVSIKDKSPPNGVDILISAKGVVGMAQFRRHHDGMEFWSAPDSILGHDAELVCSDEDISHWAYSPKPPENAS